MQVAIDKLPDVLRSCPHFDQLLATFTGKDAYLVGGAVRDALIGRSITDLDLISPFDPTSLAKLFARQIGGHWFWLDKDRLQSRVVANHDHDCLHYDFALFRAPDLERDLLDRDFTINAIALPLAGGLSSTTLVDPCRGLEDLRHGLLRMVGNSSFSNDPLRIIKGVRHAIFLDLDVEELTLQTMQFEVAGLDRIAPERVRQEIWKILGNQQAALGLKFLDQCGAGRHLFGDQFAKSLPELIDRLKVCRDLWQRLVEDSPITQEWLSQEIEQGLNIETLLLWTFLLTAIEQALPLRLADQWLFSRKAKSGVEAILGLDEVSLNSFTTVSHSERAYAWWAVKHRVDPKLLLLALAAIDSPVVTGGSVEIKDWVPIVARLSDQRPNDLVDGHWMRNELHLNDGPEMTKALELLRNAEIYGQVSSQKEARQFLTSYYQNKD